MEDMCFDNVATGLIGGENERGCRRLLMCQRIGLGRLEFSDCCYYIIHSKINILTCKNLDIIRSSDSSASLNRLKNGRIKQI